MAFASFEQCGIVKANLHEGGMVLPHHLSSFVQSAALSASGTSAVPSPTPQHPINFHSSPVINGDFDLNTHGGQMFQFMREKLRGMGCNLYFCRFYLRKFSVFNWNPAIGWC